jgi:hypothetical protein
MSTSSPLPIPSPAPIPEMPLAPAIAGRKDIPFRVAWGMLWTEMHILRARLEQDPQVSEARRRGYLPRLEQAIRAFTPPDEKEETAIRRRGGSRRRGRQSRPLGYQDGGELMAVARTRYLRLPAQRRREITCEDFASDLRNEARPDGGYYDAVSVDTLMRWAHDVYGREMTWKALCQIWEQTP